MRDCIHNNGIRATMARDGRSTTIYLCNQRSRCVHSDDEQQWLQNSNVVSCESCTLYQLRQGVPIALCSHRGDSTGEMIDCQCGVDRSIYDCDIHGRCLKRLPPGLGRERFGAHLDAVKLCSDCTDCN